MSGTKTSRMKPAPCPALLLCSLWGWRERPWAPLVAEYLDLCDDEHSSLQEKFLHALIRKFGFQTWTLGVLVRGALSMQWLKPAKEFHSLIANAESLDALLTVKRRFSAYLLPEEDKDPKFRAIAWQSLLWSIWGSASENGGSKVIKSAPKELKEKYQQDICVRRNAMKKRTVKDFIACTPQKMRKSWLLIQDGISADKTFLDTFWAAHTHALAMADVQTGEVISGRCYLSWPLTDKEREAGEYSKRFTKGQIYRIKARSWKGDALYEPQWYVTEVLEKGVSCPALEEIWEEYTKPILLEDEVLGTSRWIVK